MKAQTDLILQLSKYFHDHLNKFLPRENGEIVLTEGELNQVIDDLRRQFDKGWAKYLREKSTNAIRTEILSALQDWMMAESDEETSLIKIKPLMGVMCGMYPDEFLERGDD